MSKRKVSIITAAYSPPAGYFRETIDSVMNLKLPVGWEIEWLVQEDGQDASMAGTVTGLPGVFYSANNAQIGIAATRNLALTRATGELVQVLDHDDLLLPDAFLNLLSLFDQEIGWAVGQADDLLPDGNRRHYESALPWGEIEPGTVNDWAMLHDGNWPIHCAGLLMRTHLVRAVGGWGGAPVDDDIIMMSALSELTTGYNAPSTTWLYRVHDQQTSKSGKWRDRSADGRRIALQRIDAMRAANMSISADFASADPAKPVYVGPARKDDADGRSWWTIAD